MPELTSKPNWNLIGIIELRAEEFVQRCVEDIVELEEGLDDELQVELDNAAVCFVNFLLETMEFDGEMSHVRATKTTSELECIAICTVPF